MMIGGKSNMHSLNRLGKLVVNGHEVYFGSIIEIDYEKDIANLKVVDWRDYINTDPKYLKFSTMTVPNNSFTIKYMDDDANGTQQ